jgi:hypothetical protein
MTEQNRLMPETLEKFISEVMKIEKQYAHDRRNAKTERRSRIVEKVNDIAARELDEA